MAKIETRTAFIWLHEPSIIWTEFKEGVDVDEKDVRENLQASLHMTNGNSHAVLLNTRDKNISLTHEAMRYASTPEMSKHRFAAALVTNSIPERLFGNFIMTFFKPKLQSKIFQDTNEALEWLRVIVKQEK